MQMSYDSSNGPLFGCNLAEHVCIPDANGLCTCDFLIIPPFVLCRACVL